MKKLRVLVLADKDLVPPEKYEGKDYTDEPWKMEYDVQVTLRNLGHEVRTLGLLRNIEAVQEVQREWQPDIAFNLMEDVYGVIPYDHNVVALLELLGLAYTGCNPLGLALSRDKGLAKELLAYHRIRSPNFAVCPRGKKVRRLKRLAFPLIVKPLIEEASLGISRQSVVEDDKALAERVAFVHENLEAGAIVEQFIPGREVYVGVLGNERLSVLPPWELLIKHQPEGAPFLATRWVKWHAGYQKRLGVSTRRAEGLPEGMEARLARLSRRAYRALGLSGYARLDFRLAEDGRAYLLEANANPQLALGEDFAEAAEHAGLPYPKLLQRILDLGLRWKAAHDIV
ncbi:MAG: D-alanine--D-alanine ligase [Phycisphaerae bacterium]|nr:D-alanine--D-alanine ligase [Phycisphaerae bacterium]